MSTHPEVLWAQRSNATDATKNILYLTVRIPDSLNPTITLTETSLSIESDSSDTDAHYSLHVDFFKEVDPKQSRHHSSGNSIYFVIRKKENQEEYWPRLTKEKLKYHYIKTDFDKWVDEDEQEDAADENTNDMFSQLAAQGGAGGQLPDFEALAKSGQFPGMNEDKPHLTADDIPSIDDKTPGFGDFDLNKLAELNPELLKFKKPDGSFDLDAINDDLKLEEQKLDNDEDDSSDE